MTEHTVQAFQDELDGLSADLARMGGLAERQLERSLEAIRTNDASLAERVAADDAEVDRLDAEISDSVLRILALRQPMGADLRETVAAMKIASDLERIGDLAKNIARRAGEEDVYFPAKLSSGILRMGKCAQEQIKNALDAYSERNSGKALGVWRADRELDETYDSLFRELLTYMLEDRRSIGACMHLLFVAKHIERAGDHSTNIAETVVFLVTGERPDLPRPKGVRHGS